MSNLVDYAKDELKRIGMINSGEAYNDWAAKAILDLIELFSSQGHSGFTAPYIAGMFNRLAMFKPASPLTGEDDEWKDIGNGRLQNKRYSAVFKDKDGIAYNAEGKAFTDDGEVWYMCKDSRVNVTFPYVVPDKPEYVYKNKIEQLQPKTGHWISHKEHCENLGVMPSGLGAYEWCSNCDCGIDVREWHRNHYNYCPNCGAKMESEDK